MSVAVSIVRLMESTWENRDLPVLDAVVTIADEGDGFAYAEQIQERTGLDDETVQRALFALGHEQPPYFEPTVTADLDGRRIGWLTNVTGSARRAVGAWPTPESLAERIVQALQGAADNEPDEQKRGKLLRAAEGVGGVGRGVLTEVIASVITKSAGM